MNRENMKHMKRWFTLILAIALICILTACTSRNSGSSSEEDLSSTVMSEISTDNISPDIETAPEDEPENAPIDEDDDMEMEEEYTIDATEGDAGIIF